MRGYRTLLFAAALGLAPIAANAAFIPPTAIFINPFDFTGQDDNATGAADENSLPGQYCTAASCPMMGTDRNDCAGANPPSPCLNHNHDAEPDPSIVPVGEHGEAWTIGAQGLAGGVIGAGGKLIDPKVVEAKQKEVAEAKKKKDEKEQKVKEAAIAAAKRAQEERNEQARKANEQIYAKSNGSVSPKAVENSNPSGDEARENLINAEESFENHIEPDLLAAANIDPSKPSPATSSFWDVAAGQQQGDVDAKFVANRQITKAAEIAKQTVQNSQSPGKGNGDEKKNMAMEAFIDNANPNATSLGSVTPVPGISITIRQEK